ncbi:hypothetical protein [Halomicrobium salinisoli]|uniref:hypothetical protein n=1 Tax=Halomicrobium salinisoli TaxID=2878391 RepID=UPI001CEFC19D|nr:hypothetical protein [Halomicrobium salinisoli]
MPVKKSSQIIGSDADSLTEALESIAAEELQLVIEYDNSTHNTLYLSDRLVDDSDNTDPTHEQVEDIFEYYYIDFLERDLLEDMIWLGDVNIFATFFDAGVIFRAQKDSAAIFIVMDHPLSIDDIQITIQNAFYE